MKTIADYMVDILNENGLGGVGSGDCSLLDECARRAKVSPRISHPLNRHHCVLNGLDRSPRFKKFYIRHNGRLIRNFRLEEAHATCVQSRKMTRK